MTAEKVLKILVTVAKYFIGMAEKELRESAVKSVVSGTITTKVIKFK